MRKRVKERYDLRRKRRERQQRLALLSCVRVFADGTEIKLSKVERGGYQFLAGMVKVVGLLCEECLETLSYGMMPQSVPGSRDRRFAEVGLLDFSEAPFADDSRKRILLQWIVRARNVILPPNTKEFELGHYGDAFNINECVNISAENTHFTVIDGVLYDKSVTALLYYPREKKDKEYRMPQSVSCLSDKAMRGARRVERIVFSDNLRELGYNALSFNESLCTVDLGNGITDLDYWTIMACHKLAEITIPKQVRSYRYAVIKNCNGLKRINVEEGNETFRSVDGMLYNSKEGAFVYCPENIQLNTISIIPGTRKILSEAFSFTRNVRRLVIPASVEEIEQDAFPYCIGFEAIEVEPGNKHFVAVDGVLYSADMKQLICCPANLPQEEFHIPSTVHRIEEKAFACNTTIRRLYIPESVKSVGTKILYDTDIEDIWAPATPPEVTEGINDIFANDQYVGNRRKGEYRIHVPMGSARLYDNCDSKWYNYNNYIEDND